MIFRKLNLSLLAKNPFVILKPYSAVSLQGRESVAPPRRGKSMIFRKFNLSLLAKNPFVILKPSSVVNSERRESVPNYGWAFTTVKLPPRRGKSEIFRKFNLSLLTKNPFVILKPFSAIPQTTLFKTSSHLSPISLHPYNTIFFGYLCR